MAGSGHNDHNGDGMEPHRAHQHAKFHGEEMGKMHESMKSDGKHNPELYTGGPLGKPPEDPKTNALPERSGGGGMVKACNIVGGSPD